MLGAHISDERKDIKRIISHCIGTINLISFHRTRPSTDTTHAAIECDLQQTGSDSVS